MKTQSQGIIDHSALLLEHMRRPRNAGSIEEAPRGRGVVRFERSPEAVSIDVRIVDGHIVEARHATSGDASGLLAACASYVTEYVSGLKVWDAVDLLDQDVVHDLRLTLRDAWIAPMVVLALLEAVQDFRRRHGVLDGGQS